MGDGEDCRNRGGHAEKVRKRSVEDAVTWTAKLDPFDPSVLGIRTRAGKALAQSDR